MGRFTGWPATAYDVLLELDGDPPAAVRQRCRRDRERLVRRPMIALLQDLADLDESCDDFSVEGFVSPHYGRWQHQLAAIRYARNVTVGLRFDLDGLCLSGNWWPAEPDHLQRYRDAITDEISGSALVDLLHRLPEPVRPLIGGPMKRLPRGVPAGHPRADLLRLRSLTTELPLGSEDWLHTAEALDHVAGAVQQLRPFTSWFVSHVTGCPIVGL
ncbi:DUF2461 family protein [Microlunatus parietis]|uniref:DUF2461 family protein n=1 Tax=Microlunatus parietis TaxID=682979 RepID=A0A7Y9I4X5_9ACTN|nr:DUF2461 family protein [Microlunatus parietis]NYE70101.1 hypothetical protein [Microlunatus parietis]